MVWGRFKDDLSVVLQDLVDLLRGEVLEVGAVDHTGLGVPVRSRQWSRCVGRGTVTLHGQRARQARPADRRGRVRLNGLFEVTQPGSKAGILT